MVFLVDLWMQYLYTHSMLSNKNKGANMHNKIDFISAYNGKLELQAKSETVVKSSDIKVLIQTVLKHKLAHTVLKSSSMDFASEYGFKNNRDAMDMWLDIVREYNAIENKVFG